MPNGFWYASGGYSTDKAIPASAFSKGDLLQYDSNSSLSRLNEKFPAAADIAGIALADSTQSIDDHVTYLIPESDTHFWASLISNHASDVTPGQESDVKFDTADGRYHLDPGSTNSVRAVVVRGTDVVDQSVRSKVLTKLIYHAGNLELS